MYSARAFVSAPRLLSRFSRRFSTRTQSSSTCTDTASPKSELNSDNPLLSNWSTQPFHLPPFSSIQPTHFRSALQQAMKEELNDLQAIVDNPEDPSFENVIAAYDRSGSLLSRVGSVFGNYCSSLNTEAMQQVQTEMTPVLSRHASKTYTLSGLFDKIHAIYEQRNELNLSPEQLRLTERIHLDFERAGARFSPEQQEEYADLKARLASLSTQFQQNVLKDEESYELVLSKEEMSGCPESLLEAAMQAALERGKKEEDEYVITTSRSLVEPFLTFSDQRHLRQEAWQAWTRRGEDRGNLEIATEMLKLRRKIAQMHGYDSFAQYQCVDRMAKTPENVMKLLENVWKRAKVSADKERLALEEYVKESGHDLPGGIQPWDWRYYAEKVRIQKYDFDESLLKPYLSLDQVVNAAMAVSNKLFGLRYVRRDDIEAYHPDVVTYEVRETLSDGRDSLVAIFIHDNYARPHKSSGAWMSEYRSQTKNLASGMADVEGVPIVSNNNNFAKGKNTLLSFDDATTLFHEFGHGHHGMLSNATYSRLASTNVMTDFVELPSQLMEHWFEQPEVLKEYARHFETGEPVPDELLEKLKAAKSFNQGFETIEYTACALLDMALHQLEEYGDDFDMTDFETKELERLGMPQGIIMRHRPAHFQHLFASNQYAAGYYVYLWAEVLDADVFEAFVESGNVFDSETAAKARKYIYSSGNTVAPDELFRQFRGREPDINFMLKKKGLLE